MKLVIGGRAQGKLEIVKDSLKGLKYQLYDAELPDKDTSYDGIIVINHFHEYLYKSMKNGDNPEEEVRDFIKSHKDLIIISDEVGNGIVPIDDFERQYRDRTGRILIELARRADQVTRVVCGIGQVIK